MTIQREVKQANQWNETDVLDDKLNIWWLLLQSRRINKCWRSLSISNLPDSDSKTCWQKQWGRGGKEDDNTQDNTDTLYDDHSSFSRNLTIKKNVHIHNFSMKNNFCVKVTQFWFWGSSPHMKTTSQTSIGSFFFKEEPAASKPESGSSHQHTSVRGQRGQSEWSKNRSHTERVPDKNTMRCFLCTFLYNNTQMVDNEVRFCLDEDRRDFIHQKHVNMKL